MDHRGENVFPDAGLAEREDRNVAGGEALGDRAKTGERIPRRNVRRRRPGAPLSRGAGVRVGDEGLGRQSVARVAGDRNHWSRVVLREARGQSLRLPVGVLRRYVGQENLVFPRGVASNHVVRPQAAGKARFHRPRRALRVEAEAQDRERRLALHGPRALFFQPGLEVPVAPELARARLRARPLKNEHGAPHRDDLARGEGNRFVRDELLPAEEGAVGAPQVDDLDDGAEEKAGVGARELSVGDHHLAMVGASNHHYARLGEGVGEHPARPHHEKRQARALRRFERAPNLRAALSVEHALHY